MSKRGYKRSWKNLLLDKNYQLAFTAVLVVCTAIPMAGLGWYVMKQASSATEVAKINVTGRQCEAPPTKEEIERAKKLDDAMAPAGTGVTPGTEPVQPDTDAEQPAEPSEAAPSEGADKDKEPTPEGADGSAEQGDEGGEAATDAGPGEEGTEGEEARPARRVLQVTIDDSEMQTVPAPKLVVDDAALAKMRKKYDECVATKNSKKAELEAGETLIFRVLVGSCVFLLLALVLYGIKLTHKVAGPLFKVGLYLDKIRDGRYDTVYNLRKGDHLVEFYEHFKSAHDGLKTMQREDIEALKAVIEAAEAANVADASPEVKAQLDELKRVLEEKEGSLV